MNFADRASIMTVCLDDKQLPQNLLAVQRPAVRISEEVGCPPARGGDLILRVFGNLVGSRGKSKAELKLRHIQLEL